MPLSLVAFDNKQAILGFASFSDSPNIAAVEPSSWDLQFRKEFPQILDFNVIVHLCI